MFMTELQTFQTPKVIFHTRVPSASYGAQRGEERSQHSVQEGTVKMEWHPAFRSQLEKVQDEGFNVQKVGTHPSISISRITEKNGDVRVAKTLFVCRSDALS
jgi:hypothetical protein